jgi:hypothetical protein
MRRSIALFIVILLGAARAEAVTVRDLIELSRAGLSDEVLIALIDVDHDVFTLDTPTLKQLKQAGVSDAVILAMIRSGRTAASDQSAAPQEGAAAPADIQPPAAYVPVAVPVPVPVFVPTPRRRPEYIKTIVRTNDGGEVNAKVPLPPNCTKAEPVYWGFGGKLRPNSWEPPPTVVCR